MMRPAELQDRLYKALNTAARAVGADTYAYRASGPDQPLHTTNRFLRLRAAFSAQDGKFAHPNKYGDALWYGVFDAAYTQPGDYLVQDDSVWFIAAQQRLLPVLCVQTNRVVSFSRPAAPTDTGVNAYGGIITATNTPLLTGWPASVLGASGRGHPDTDLPADVAIPYWTVLLPAFPGIILCPSDLMTDDLGRSAVIAAAELTDFGWRLSARQATN
jgi:hypothetical protein